MITIQDGESYVTRDGTKVGPMFRADRLDGFPWEAQPDGDQHPWAVSGWSDHGQYTDRPQGDGRDIIGKWSNKPGSPVRTVTRREIVPGTYGRIAVERGTDDGRITLSFVDRAWGGKPSLNADELRAAAATLNEIADVLDEQQVAP